MSKNVVISGFPKSGTVWVTRLVAELLNCPFKGFWGSDHRVKFIEGEDRISEYGCYQSHMRYDQIDQEQVEKIIYVIRDPRDIVVSGAHSYMYYSTYYKPLPAFIAWIPRINWLNVLRFRTTPFRLRCSAVIKTIINGNPAIAFNHDPWNMHVNSYRNQGVYFIRYEDLVSDPIAEISRLLPYINLKVTEQELSSVIQKQSFDNRKKEFERSGDKINANHLRNGTCGNWKHELTKSQAQSIEDAFNATMKQYNYL